MENKKNTIRKIFNYKNITLKTELTKSLLGLMLIAFYSINSISLIAQNAPNLRSTSNFACISNGSIHALDTIQMAGKIGAVISVDSLLYTHDFIYIGNTGIMQQALADKDSTFSEIDALGNATTISGSLGGQSLSSGIYRINSAANLNGILTLTGNANAIYIFIINDSLLVNPYGRINMPNVNASNIYWRVHGSITLQDSCFFNGILLSDGNINSGLYNHGRLSMLSSGDISLQFKFDAPAVPFNYYSQHLLELLLTADSLQPWTVSCPADTGNNPGIFFFGANVSSLNLGLETITNSSYSNLTQLCPDCIDGSTTLIAHNSTGFSSIDMLAANPINHYMYFGGDSSSTQYALFKLGLDLSGNPAYVQDILLNQNGGGATCDNFGYYWFVASNGSIYYLTYFAAGDYTDPGGNAHMDSVGVVIRPNTGVTDVAFNPLDCSFYAQSGDSLFRFYADTNSTSVIITGRWLDDPFVPGFSGSCGALAIGTDFNLYGINNGGSYPGWVQEINLPLPSGSLSGLFNMVISSPTWASSFPTVQSPSAANTDAASFICYDPEPSFTWVYACDSPSYTVNFTNGTYIYPSFLESSILVTWDFGDSHSTTTTGVSNVSHTYTSPGTYTVSINLPGCPTAGSTQYSATITIDSNLAFILVVVNDSCFHNDDGSITAIASNGYPPYSYLWSNGSTTSIISGLSVGTYSVTVTDSMGCFVIITDSVVHETNCCLQFDSAQVFNLIPNGTTISYPTIWTGHYYIEGNLTVDNAILDITNVDVVFAPCATIVFQNGAVLRGNNSVFRPCDIYGVWNGLTFTNCSDNIIDECTFKNATNALNFIGTSDGKVTNNLFYNCDIGINCTDSKDFKYPISGNRFEIDQFISNLTFSNCSFNDSLGFYIGIKSLNTNFYYPISQNYFVNADNGNFNSDTYLGILFLGSGGQISQNTFTDATNAIIIENPNIACSIENNQIELLNSQEISPYLVPTQILVSNTRVSVLIYHNTIINSNPDPYQYAQYYGIDVTSSYFVDVNNNTIDGFFAGIYMKGDTLSQVIENTISNCHNYGVYVEKADYIHIGCNIIDLHNDNSEPTNIGIAFYEVGQKSTIYSNCVFNTQIGIYLQYFTCYPIPDVRNNYIYNYTQYGLFDNNYFGSIGTAPFNPGLNTFYSNSNAPDIFYTHNVGCPPILNAWSNWLDGTSLNILIVNSVINTVYSNASCANQINGLPSQHNLNVVGLECDQMRLLIYPLITDGGKRFNLANDFEQKLSNMNGDLFSLVLSIQKSLLSNSDKTSAITFNNAVNQLNWISDNEKLWVNYYYYFSLQNWTQASANHAAIHRTSQDEEDLWNIELINLKRAQGNYINSVPNTGDLNILENIAGNKGDYSNYAIAEITGKNNTNIWNYSVLLTPDKYEIDNTKHSNNYIDLFPNPAKDKLTLLLITKDKVKIEMEDITGRVLKSWDFENLADQITMDISDLNSGIYILKSSFSDKVTTSKFCKIK